MTHAHAARNTGNAIVNNEHWISRRYKVKNHAAGTAEFDYDVDPTNELCQKYGEGDYRAPQQQ